VLNQSPSVFANTFTVIIPEREWSHSTRQLPGLQ